MRKCPNCGLLNIPIDMTKVCCSKSCATSYSHKKGKFSNIDRSAMAKEQHARGDFDHVDHSKKFCKIWASGAYDHIDQSAKLKKQWLNGDYDNIDVSTRIKDAWNRGCYDHIDRSDITKKAWMRGDFEGVAVGVGISGYYESTKVGRIFYRSTYERRAYEILDSDNSVMTYQCEPFPIPLDNGRNYYPDILAEYENNVLVLIEVKPKCFVMDDIVQYKARAAIEYCKNNGISKYIFWTEENLM